MVTVAIGTSQSRAAAFSCPRCSAKGLGAAKRMDLAVRALAGGETITELADRHDVSRNFVYQQKAKAAEALQEAFGPACPGRKVLFHHPVTEDWLEQFVLAQVLIGHTSFRGVTEILDAVFDYRRLSIATVHNIVQHAVAQARRLNEAQDLSGIRVGGHDEIYQAGRPVLVGVDLHSTFCYLLAAEDGCDETTWGMHLLELAERGLCPDRTIADGGRPLRAGQAAAWGGIPCHGDVFHALRELGRLAHYLANRARGCTAARRKLQQQGERLKQHKKGRRVSARLAAAGRAERQAVALAQDIDILTDWMQGDILAHAGPEVATRRQLYGFVVAELREREAFCPHRIGPVRRMLENHQQELLGFADVLEERFADLARQWQVPVGQIHAVSEWLGTDPNTAGHWQRRDRLYRQLGQRLPPIQQAVREVLAKTPRASSLTENFNSRLRNYFFLRRHIGPGYLALLQFFLNHRRFLRSERPERVGKSPAELLSGQPQRHWLELLGYDRFRRN